MITSFTHTLKGRDNLEAVYTECPLILSYLLFLQQHHHFKEEDIVNHHLLILVQDLERFAADDIVLY